MQKWKMRHGEDSLFLPKSSAIPMPPPSLQLGTELGGFFPPITVSNVTQGASYCMGWLSIADGKRVCPICTRHLPGTSRLALSQKHSAFGGNSRWPAAERILATTFPWLGAVGQGWAGRVPRCICPEQRALLFWCLSLANEKSPREKHIAGTTQQARIQDRRCELKACYSDNDHK